MRVSKKQNAVEPLEFVAPDKAFFQIFCSTFSRALEASVQKSLLHPPQDMRASEKRNIVEVCGDRGFRLSVFRVLVFESFLPKVSAPPTA